MADNLTSPDSNRYVFKTSRNSSMDMQAQALALQPDENLYVATLAQDYAFGRDGVAAFKEKLEGTGAHLVAEEYVPQNTTHFAATIERLFNALRDQSSISSASAWPRRWQSWPGSRRPKAGTPRR